MNCEPIRRSLFGLRIQADAWASALSLACRKRREACAKAESSSHTSTKM